MSIHSSMTSIDRLSGVGASAGGLSSALGVVRCGRSAGCVLCVLWAISAAVGGGVPCGGKHIIIDTYYYNDRSKGSITTRDADESCGMDSPSMYTVQI